MIVCPLGTCIAAAADSPNSITQPGWVVSFGQSLATQLMVNKRNRVGMVAGLDEIENRGRFLSHSIRRHGYGVRQHGLVCRHLDTLHEVADEGLASGKVPPARTPGSPPRTLDLLRAG